MSSHLMAVSERWFRLLLRFYPADFRDDMGEAVVEAYRVRAREALLRGGVIRLAAVWVQALADSIRNGPGERARPAASWRRQQRTSAALITAFALGALLLAAMGLFGVVSGSVTTPSRARREAGARRRSPSRASTRAARGRALLVGIGVLTGVPGIYAAGGLIRGVLVGVSPSDPLTLAAVALGLALVTLATCYVPARRVLAIEPAQLLREE